MCKQHGVTLLIPEFLKHSEASTEPSGRIWWMGHSGRQAHSFLNMCWISTGLQVLCRISVWSRHVPLDTSLKGSLPSWASLFYTLKNFTDEMSTFFRKCGLCCALLLLFDDVKKKKNFFYVAFCSSPAVVEDSLLLPLYPGVVTAFKTFPDSFVNGLCFFTWSKQNFIFKDIWFIHKYF